MCGLTDIERQEFHIKEEDGYSKVVNAAQREFISSKLFSYQKEYINKFVGISFTFKDDSTKLIENKDDSIHNQKGT